MRPATDLPRAESPSNQNVFHVFYEKEVFPMKKRVLSTLLALLFAVSLIPAALAAAPPDLDLASEATV